MAKKRTTKSDAPPAPEVPPLRLEWRSPAELAENPRNWRTHPQEQIGALTDVLAEVGWAGACLYNEETNRLIDGHARRKVALDQGAEKIPVLVGRWTPEQEAKILATFDPIGAMAEADKGRLDALLREVSTGSAAVQQMLTDLAEKAGVIPGMGSAPEPGAGGDEFDTAAALEGECRVKPGEVWLIDGGKHRIGCLDCTKPDDMDRLLDGQKPTFVYTDPPYGINVIKGSAGQWGGVAARYIPVANDSSSDVAKRAYDLVAAMNVPVQIFWGANHYSSALPDSPCWIVWYKRMGTDANDFADCELAWTNQTSRARLFHHVWNGFLRDSERGEERVHPTQKPVALAEWCLKEFGKPDDLVLDLFLGSGSSLIGAHRIGRRCFGAEIDERYCEAVLRRAEAENLSVEKAG